MSGRGITNHSVKRTMYEGSSKGMEKEAALRIWGRWVEKINMHYTGMLSDGDSVAYKAVCEANLYPVRKLECVNHCDKRGEVSGYSSEKKKSQGGATWWASLWCTHCQLM